MNESSLLGFMTPSEFDIIEKVQWLEGNWTWSLWVTGLYICFIFLGPRWMKGRDPWNIQAFDALWNFTLAVFSASACSVFIPQIVRVYQSTGFYGTVCSQPNVASRDTQFWAWLFMVFKMVELGDTFFIVLRKKRLLFLHWYHHVTVLIATWQGFSELCSVGGWFGVMNSIVHTLMYSYFGFKSFNLNIPRWIAKMITTVQLMQMGMALIVIVYAYLVKLNGIECPTSYKQLHITFAVGASYLFLFGKHFYNNYISPYTRTILTE